MNHVQIVDYSITEKYPVISRYKKKIAT